MRCMYNSTLLIDTAPRKEIRFGQVTITGTAECEDTDGDFHATVIFLHVWDDVESLADYFGIDTNDESAIEVFAESLPTYDGDVCVAINTSVFASSVESLLQKIDALEDELVRRSSELWNELEATWKS